MLKNKILLGIILSIILLLFSINGFATDYKYTQESGAGFFVGSPDKSDAQEDTNEIRQIVNDLGTLLFHSKMDGLYPKDLTTGGTIQIPETGLKFGNDPVNDDIAAYISGEMMWQTKAELGIDLTLYYLKTEINTQTKVETIWGVSLVNDGDLDLYYLKTAIDTQSEMETIWGVSLANDSELHSQNTDTDLNATFELTFVKKTDNVNVLNDITSPGADIEDAVTKKHTSGSETLIGDVSGTVGANTVDKIKDHTVDETDIGDNKILVYKTTGNKYVYEAQSGGGASTFVELTDTPVNYTGQAGLYTKVNAGETALEFGTPAGGVDTSGTPEALDIARFTDVDTIEGINYMELKTALALSSGDLSDVASIAMLDENEAITGAWTVSGSIAGVDGTEFGYLDGVTSDIQTQLNAKKGKNYYSALGSDHTYSDNADTDSQPVGEAVAYGDLLYPDWTAGEWLKTDADLAAKMPGLRIALESKTDGQTCLMLVKGYIRDDSAFEFSGSMVYTSVTPGAMSSTAPTETGDQLQRVGVAKSADILFFDPSIDVGEI